MDLDQRGILADAHLANDRLEAASLEYLAVARECIKRLKHAPVNPSSTSDQGTITTGLIQTAKRCVGQLKNLSNAAEHSPQERDEVHHLLNQVTSQLVDITNVHPSQGQGDPAMDHLRKPDTRSVPRIPISSLTQLSLVYAHSVAVVSQRLQKVKRASRSNHTTSLTQLRSLLDDEKIQRGRLSHIHHTMDTIVCQRLLDWDVDVLARNLTLIDAQLFAQVKLDDMFQTQEKSQALMVCLDFQRYLQQAWLHELITTLCPAQSDTKPRKSSKTLDITQFIKTLQFTLDVAEVGLTTYRNLNLTMIISHVIHSSELQIVFDQFSCLSRPLRERVQRITLNPTNSELYQSYERLLCKVLALSFSNTSPSGSAPVDSARVYAIPSLIMHRNRMTNLYNLYTVVPGNPQRGNASQLTDVGTEKLQLQRDLLGATRGSHQAFENLGIAFPVAQKPTYRPPTPILSHLSKPARLMPFDLATLVPLDLSAHHWLLTRPFLTPAQTLQEAQTLVGPVNTNGHRTLLPDSPLPLSNVTDIQGVNDASATSHPVTSNRAPSPVENISNQPDTSQQTPALSFRRSPEPSSQPDRRESVTLDILTASTGTTLGLITEAADTRPEKPHVDAGGESVTSSVEDFLVYLDQHLQGSPTPQPTDLVNKSSLPTETKSEEETPPARIPTPLGRSTNLTKYLFEDVSPQDDENAFVYPNCFDKESDTQNPDDVLLSDEERRPLSSQAPKHISEEGPATEVFNDTTDAYSHRERSSTMASEQSELKIDLRDLLVAATVNHAPAHEIQPKETPSPSPLRHSIDDLPHSKTKVPPTTTRNSETGVDYPLSVKADTLVPTTNITQLNSPIDTDRVGETLPTTNALSLRKDHTAGESDQGYTDGDERSESYEDDSDDEDDDDHETMVISFADLAVRNQEIS
ncbi:hypothetical protein IWQ61_006506 [Dispira simplex]|nr:hypothetical protein IWQ61_006506 [Dispira simplex]